MTPRPPRTALSLVWLIALSVPAAASFGQDLPGRVTPPPPTREQPEAVVPPPATPTTRPMTRPMTPQTFDSIERGLRIVLPAGESQPVDPAAAGGDLLALVLNPAQGWRVELRQVDLPTPSPLASEELPEGGRRPGLLEMQADATMRAVGGGSDAAQGTDRRPGAEAVMLRQSLVPLARGDAGVFVLRYTSGLVTLLQQVALLRVDDGRYFQLTMLSPAPAGPAEGLADDPQVRQAVAAFNAALDSYEPLDQSQILADQERRLDLTRSLFVNITARKVVAALVPERVVRIKQDGRDVGYRLVVEEPAKELPADAADRPRIEPLEATGARIGVKTLIFTPQGRLGRETWMFADAKISEEGFRERNVLRDVEAQAAGADDRGVRDQNVVVGTMRVRAVPKKVSVPRPGGLGTVDRIDIVEERRLEVHSGGDGLRDGKTVERLLPAWYLPQALEHLLPRLVAPLGPNQYLVAVYAPDRQEVWQQYVDVSGPSTETVDGERRTAYVVTTRLGLSGPATRHFVSPNTFEWLGSVSDDGVENWPSDVATLRGIWGEAEVGASEMR